jgi:hypothetical protein
MPATIPAPQWSVVIDLAPKNEKPVHYFATEGDARHYLAECRAHGFHATLVSDGLVVE